MIVVDSNVIAYCWLSGALTEQAQAIRVTDPDWHVPMLWRSELRSILAGYFRDGSLSLAQVKRTMETIEAALSEKEHIVPSSLVFRIIERSRLSAYDCEFVALAGALSVPLVTADKAMLKAFPGIAISMGTFVETSQSRGT